MPVRDVADYTGFPEMMDGRVKTLHPRVHGGVLCRHDNDSDDMAAAAEHGIVPFELVVVNLYPVPRNDRRSRTVTLAAGNRENRHRRPDARPLGGQEPRLRRRSPRQPARSTTGIARRAGQSRRLHVARSSVQQLAAAAFAHTAEYDTAIAGYFEGQSCDQRRFARRIRPSSPSGRSI